MSERERERERERGALPIADQTLGPGLAPSAGPVYLQTIRIFQLKG